ASPAAVTPRLVKLRRPPERVLATDGDQRVHTQVLQVVLDPRDAVLDGERVGPRGAQNRAAPRQQPAHRRDVQRHGRGLERASPAVAEAEERVPVLRYALADDGPDDRVQPGAVPASGEHPDTHDAPLLAV